MSTQVITTGYGRPALESLRAVVAEVKRGDPMAPVTVLVPTNIAGIVARRFLARGLSEDRPGIAGLFVSTLPRLAEQLASPTLTAEGRRPATRTVTAATIRRTLANAPGVFEPVAEHPSTSRALATAISSLRDVDDEALSTLEAASTLTADLIRLHRQTTAALAADWYDTTDLLTTASWLVTDGQRDLTELGTVVLHLPQDLTRAELSLARALADHLDLRLVAGLTGQPRADKGVLATLAALAPGTEPTPPPASLATRVLNASDSDDEIRCVVREVVQAVRTHPAHRIAVLYADRSPYARLLHEHLGAAGIAVNGPGVRPVNERATSRLLLGLLECARTGLRRADLFRVLGELAVRDLTTGERLPTTRWERISREAGIVAAPHWADRLATYAATQQAAIQSERERDEPRDWVIARAGRDVDTATALSAFVAELERRLDDASALSSWAELGRSVLDLFHTLLPQTDAVRLPLEEQYAYGVVERALTGLAALDQTGSTPDLPGLEEVLQLELESALPRVGRFGEGVLVAPVTHAIGLDLDVVYVVGLSEDLFPGRLRDDSLLPQRVRDQSTGQLPSIRASVDFRHRSLLAAFAAAKHVVATFPRGDLRRHTHRLPSRWLLPTLRAHSGDDRLPATEWHKASAVAGADAWLTTNPSYAAGLLNTASPGTEQEWRTRAASADLDLADAVVDQALTMQRARESGEFTRFDGNLSGQPGLPDYAQGTPSVSTTALERFAICPHAWFVERMLKVAPLEAPEELLEISAMDIGNLIHQSFDELIRASADSLPGYGEPWSPAHRRRLQEIAAARAAGYEAEGRTGHPVLWARVRGHLLTDLDRMLDDDNAWRAAQDARVLASELAFGMDGQPEVEVKVDGGIVRFRGSADKVDQRRDGTLLVTDIKSGSARTFKGLSADNPIANGEKLQLPVYAHAARARFGSPTTAVEAMYWFVRKDRGTRVQVPLTEAVQQVYAAAVGQLTRSVAAGAFPQRAPEKPDFRWVTCPFCNPDGLGHAEPRRRWEAKRLRPELIDYTALVEPAAVPSGEGDELPGEGQA